MTAYSVDPEKIIGYEFPRITYTYTERDVSLYALGVGAPADPLDQKELQFVYELSGEGFKVLPTFAVLFPSRMIDDMLTGSLPGMTYNPMLLLHGEQYLEIHQPLPTHATITCAPRISAVYDKGSGALVIADVPCYDESGTEVAFGQYSMFIRGIGGFGGVRGASETNAPPAREPDAVITDGTTAKQALIYRLSGDTNPLHADPLMAALGSFDKPILHGLCSFGYAGRAVLKSFCANDPARFKSIKVRFVKHVFPGETLVTEMWHEGDRVYYQTKVAERGTVALSNGVVELRL